MDGIHDLGGMEGFGSLQIEKNEPVFHADWEARTMAMRVLMGFWRKWNIDAGRHSIENLPPADYLGFSYYEKWLASLVNLLVGAELVTVDEVKKGFSATTAKKSMPPIDAAGLEAFLPVGKPAMRELGTKPQFSVGDRVHTLSHMPSGHHRLPRYIRGHFGEIILYHGAHVFPDTNACFAGENPQHLYTVRFSAKELWGGDASIRDTVTAELWESYLEPE